MKTADKPNILLILIDDLGWRDLTCFGSEFYETPYLDQLAANGMRFTHAYASAPVCSPTRASLLTGRYPARVGVTDWIYWGHVRHPCRGRLIDAPYVDHLPLSEISLARALRQAGYATWHVGKWHLGGPDFYPQHHGFDVNIGGCEWGMPMHGYFSPWGCPTLQDGPPGEYLTDRLTEEAIRLIEKSPSDQPFFMHLAHYAVHIPIQVPNHYVEKYREKAKRLGLDQARTFEEGEYFPCEHKRHLRVIRRLLQSDPAYAGMIENLDWNIGRVLAALSATGRADNTVVIFTSDNGGLATSEGSPTCNAPLSEGKGWVYEGGTRVPLIIKWPGKTPCGAICTTPVTSPDLYPTILQMAGLDLMSHQHCDGESLVPLLAGSGLLAREAIFWHYPHYGNQGGTPASSMRIGHYKLIEFFEDGRLELYNLREDPSEDNNLAQDKPALANELQARLAVWRQTVNAKLPLPNPDYQATYATSH